MAWHGETFMAEGGGFAMPGQKVPISLNYNMETGEKSSFFYFFLSVSEKSSYFVLLSDGQDRLSFFLDKMSSSDLPTEVLELVLVQLPPQGPPRVRPARLQEVERRGGQAHVRPLEEGLPQVQAARPSGRGGQGDHGEAGGWQEGRGGRGGQPV